ncbi:glycosyltransferase family 2 protein [Ornithinimicrobium pratense]|uniref:Glycosyltransferase n=1 Tax=Ornithinimicrobium pratense TaxID=2593973 RepID=A0A5J6V8U0_9MICO|nr:glycosyltransferase [Ornithinimicrobium pratense]QFG69774.1 glycosyltransferase [Ornithinimicrobium pratense]
MTSPQRPMVSVVVPAYNAQDTIGACLSGLLTQTYPHVEIVVIDDGSTDQTAEICRAYGPLVRYQRQENAGSAAARNAAFSLVRGDLIAFCDADDMLLPAYLDRAVAAYQDAGGGRRIVMSDALQLTSTGLAHGRRLIGPHFPRRRQRLAILQKNFVPILSVFPRALLEDVPGFAEDLDLVEDWEFWIRAVLTGWEVIFQPEPHALYRLSPDAKSTDDRRHEAEDEIIRRVRDQYREELTPQEQEFVSLRLTTPPPRFLDLQAGEALRDGDDNHARTLYRQLATLSSEDPRVRARALLLGYVPGATRLGRWRQQMIDRQMGGRIQATPTPSGPETVPPGGDSTPEEGTS